MARRDLTPAAAEGYAAEPDARCPHMATSDNSNAWYIGRWLKSTGRTAPRDVSPSRGHRVRANDMVLLVNSRGEVTRVE